MTYASEQGSEQKQAFLRRGEKSKMWSERERKDGKGRPGAGGAGPDLTTALWRGAGCAFQHRVYVDSLSLRVCIQIPEPLKTYSITTGIFKNYFLKNWVRKNNTNNKKKPRPNKINKWETGVWLSGGESLPNKNAAQCKPGVVAPPVILAAEQSKVIFLYSRSTCSNTRPYLKQTKFQKVN